MTTETLPLCSIKVKEALTERNAVQGKMERSRAVKDEAWTAVKLN